MPFERKNKTRFPNRYNPPRQSPRLLKPIAVIIVVTLIFFGLDLFAGTNFFAGEGPLSSSHATLGSQCNTCHTQNWTRAEAAMEEQCVRCHIDDKPLKFHVSSHRKPGVEERKIRQRYCVDCHIEHRGREARLAQVADRPCRDCHSIHDADRDHPDFNPKKLEAQNLKGIGLQFSHKTHQINERYSEKMNSSFEKECVLCHNLDSGQGFVDFKAIDFNADCRECHPHQELMLTKVFSAEKAEQLAQSIEDVVGKFGVESFDTFLSRFEYRKGNKRRRRPAAFKYVPVHKDPYLKYWFSREGVSPEQVEDILSQGRKGATLNCLKCHTVADAEKEPHKAGAVAITAAVSLTPVLPHPDSASNKVFPHKKHARVGCEQCHESILSSEGLEDRNILVEKKHCFNCHNKRSVKNECTHCHLFHKKPDPAKLSTLIAAGSKKDTPGGEIR